jgi:hypothetical protein
VSKWYRKGIKGNKEKGEKQKNEKKLVNNK